MSALTEADIKPGRIYEAKRPRPAGPFFAPRINDRQVLWISSERSQVQYDSPAVAGGRLYPRVSIETFLKWAGRDVTELMPREGRWREYVR